jgi:hypothetical protein
MCANVTDGSSVWINSRTAPMTRDASRRCNCTLLTSPGSNRFNTTYTGVHYCAVSQSVSQSVDWYCCLNATYLMIGNDCRLESIVSCNCKHGWKCRALERFLHRHEIIVAPIDCMVMGIACWCVADARGIEQEWIMCNARIGCQLMANRTIQTRPTIRATDPAHALVVHCGRCADTLLGITQTLLVEYVTASMFQC